jgi:L-threonylcarbamoyladenylate synthase
MSIIITINPEYPNEFSLQETVRCLRNGGIIIYPTETFYGIGALFTNESTLKRLFAIKQRDAGKPVLLLIPDFSFIKNITPCISPALETLAGNFWPGPLTLLITALPHLSPLVADHRRTVGVRISSNPIVQQILGLLQDGITSSSANISGDVSPSSIEEISAAVLNAVDIVIDGGKTPGESPSTVFDISSAPFKIVRKGVISLSQIIKALERTGL